MDKSRSGRLAETDPHVEQALRHELSRQQQTIELIASENFASPAVMAAQGSVLTNKYAEGYPGNRYYAGCEHVDEVEELARDRLRELFGADHANVQPHSGSQANMAVYFSVLDPGDTILSMALDHGGHLSHGHPVNFAGQFYDVVTYGVDRETERIDYDAVRRQALEAQPKLIVAGASAYPRTVDFAEMRSIADAVGAYLMADIAHIAGLCAAGAHPSPWPHAHFITTTTHKTLRGPRGGAVLCHGDLAKQLDKTVFPGIQGGPLMHVIAAKAVAFQEALGEAFRAYQHRIVENARALAAALADRGYRLVSGGTDNHLVLVDLRPKGITGAEAEERLEAIGVTVNKNAIPFDPEKPSVTSGIRLGTPAVTTRGMDADAMARVADLIDRALSGASSEALRRDVRELCSAFPLYTSR